MRRTVDLKPVLVVFLIAFLALGLGSVMSLSPIFVFGVFLVILIIAFLVLVRSMMRRNTASSRPAVRRVRSLTF